MVAVARETYPHLRFDVGSLDHLALEDGALAGAVVWYSLIHTPPAQQPRVFAELRRVLAPGGHLLLAFQVGEDQRVHREVAYGHAVPLDSFRLSPDRVAEQLAEAGLTVHTRTFRGPEGEFETTPQAFLLARG
jgi:ubiquinone/menaquinone biosynthesis C-methylase UbiE